MRARILAFAICTVAAAASGSAQPPSPPRAAGQPRAPQAPPPPAASAREQPPPPPAPPPVAAARTRREGQPVNVKIEFTLTDQRGTAAPVKRTVALIVADGHTGMIRSQSQVYGLGSEVPLNVDTSPELLADGKIRLGFNIQYDWPAPVDTPSDRNPPRGTVAKTSIHDSISLILENGKPIVAAQSADPIGDRQVSVEVKATVLK